MRALWTLAALCLAAQPTAAAMQTYTPQRLAALQAQGRTVVVQFVAAGCAVCGSQSAVMRALGTESLPAPAVLQASFEIHAAFRREHEVTAPSTLLLLRSGVVIGKAVGLASIGAVRRFIREHRMRARSRPGPRPLRTYRPKR